MKAKNKSIYRKKRTILWAAGIDDVTALSRLMRKSRQWTSDVWYGHQESEPNRLAILKILHDRGLEIEYEDLWPNGHNNSHRKAA